MAHLTNKVILAKFTKQSTNYFEYKIHKGMYCESNIRIYLVYLFGLVQKNCEQKTATLHLAILPD